MKRIAATLAILLFAGCENMTPINDAEKGKPVEFVQSVSGKSKNAIFSSSKAWVAETFILGKAIIIHESRTEGRLAVKAHIPYPCKEKCDDDILFTLNMEIKDGEIKLSYTDIRISRPLSTINSGEPVPVHLQRDLDAAKAEFNRLSNRLQAFIMGENGGSGF